MFSLSLSSSLSLTAKKLQKTCCRHSTNVPRTKPNKPCDGNKIGTTSPYNISISGVHPLHTSALGIWLTRAYNFGTSGVHPLRTSVLRSSCLETNQVCCCSRTLLPVPLSLFSCTSPFWSWPLTGLSSFCVWVSNQVDTVVLEHLNHQAFLYRNKCNLSCIYSIMLWLVEKKWSPRSRTRNPYVKSWKKFRKITFFNVGLEPRTSVSLCHTVTTKPTDLSDVFLGCLYRTMLFF